MSVDHRSPLSVAPGDEPPPRETAPVSRTDIVRFAGAGGDFNPLHHDPDFAARAGFPDVIAMGQYQAGVLAGWLTDWCGVEHLLRLELRFRRRCTSARCCAAAAGSSRLASKPAVRLPMSRSLRA